MRYNYACNNSALSFSLDPNLDVAPGIVNKKDNNGNTPLHEACICGSLIIVEELLTHGADEESQNYAREIPLHAACKKGFDEIVTEILHHDHKKVNALVKAIDNSRSVPMHLAVESGSLKTVKVLLQYGANPSMPNKVQVMPIHIAAEQGFIQIAKTILEHDKFCLDALDDQHQSPLHYAARANEIEMIAFLISQ